MSNLVEILERWKLNSPSARVNIKLGVLREAADRIEALERERDRCHERLEIDHYWKIGDNDDSDLERVDIPLDEREAFPDGIEARDATISFLEADLAASQAEVIRLKEALKQVVADYDACSGAEPSLSVLHRSIDLIARSVLEEQKP